MNELPDWLLEEAQRLTDEASELWNSRSYPCTEALCRKALELTRAAVGDRDRRVAERLYNLASLYHFQRRFEEAKPLYREAISIHEAQSSIDRSALAFCYAWMAKTHFEGWRDDPGIDGEEDGRSFEEAENCYRKTLTLLKRAGAAGTPEYTGCLMQIGFLYYYCDRYSDAEPIFTQALELRERIFGKDHIETAEPIGRLAILYWQDPASQVNPEPWLRKALAIRLEHLDANDPELWEWTYRLADFCWASEKSTEATALYGRLGEMLLDAANPTHDDVEWIAAGYLDHLLDTNQAEQAAAIGERWFKEPANLRLKRQEIRRREAMLGPDHPRVADSLRVLADDLRFDDRFEEARALYERALLIREAADGCASPSLLPILNGLAMLHRAQGDISSAGEVLKRACRIPFDAEAAVESLHHARAVEQLAWVRSAQESPEEAETLFCQAIHLIEADKRPDYREAAEMRYRFSIFLAQKARFAEAEENIVAALKAGENTCDLDDLEIADYREQYASILTALDKPLKAIAQLAEVKRLWRESGASRDDL